MVHPVLAQGSAAKPVLLRALNERGKVIGEAWATPTREGYVTVRGLLAGAYEAAIVEDERTQAVTHILGDDTERNLIVIATALSPESAAEPMRTPAIDAEGWQIECATNSPIPMKDAQVRDLPTFGMAYVAKTAHGENVNGCPVFDQQRQWQGVVVWESPMARPSVVVVPTSYVRPLARKQPQSWAEWRGAQAVEGVRFRNSLLLEGLQDIWRAQYANALDSLSLIVEKNPRDGRAWYYRGYAKAMSGDRKGAMEDYEQAVFYDSENPDAHFSLGFTYLLMRREIEAREQAKELDKIDEVMAAKLRMLIDAMSDRSVETNEDSDEIFGLPDGSDGSSPDSDDEPNSAPEPGSSPEPGI
jgi:hypothetical protein